MRAVADSRPRQISSRQIGRAAGHHCVVDFDIDVEVPVRCRRIEGPSVQRPSLDPFDAAFHRPLFAESRYVRGKRAESHASNDRFHLVSAPLGIVAAAGKAGRDQRSLRANFDKFDTPDHGW
jgi:hypothetical protein